MYKSLVLGSVGVSNTATTGKGLSFRNFKKCQIDSWVNKIIGGQKVLQLHTSKNSMTAENYPFSTWFYTLPPSPNKPFLYIWKNSADLQLSNVQESTEQEQMPNIRCLSAVEIGYNNSFPAP